MKRLFEAVERHAVIFVLVTTLLAMASINFMAYLILEKDARRKQTKNTLAQEEVLKKVFGENLVEDYRTVSIEQSIGQKYYPFVEYIEKARNGKFVNVSSQGTRCHYPNRDLCAAKGGLNEIWLFGGSTTFGYGVKDKETIAAYLADRLPDYRIVNFGAASYYSTIERVRFENLLAEFAPPKAAIFIDGLNDFYYFNVPDTSAYSSILKAADEFIVNVGEPHRSLDNDVRALLKHLAIFRLLHNKFLPRTKTPDAAIASQEQISKAIARFHLNHSIVEAIGQKFGISVLNVLQPVPTYGVGHKTSKVPQESLNFGDHTNSGLAYREMLTPNGELHHQDAHTLNLANLGINEGMYIDTVHYSPIFNQKIALEICKRLVDLLKDKKTQAKGTRCGSASEKN